jgi:hypothetical protein
MRTFIIPAPSMSAISEIELDRLLDRVRTAIEPNRMPALLQPPIAANDDQLAWPSIPFPKGWNAAS